MQDNNSDFDAATPQNRENVIRFEKIRAANKNKPEHPPLLNMPEATKVLTISIALVFMVMWGTAQLFPSFPSDLIFNELGFVSARWTGDLPFGLTALFSLVTVNFLHGGWFHMGVNVATLVAFGSGIEKRMGATNMLVLFFLSSIVALISQLLISPHSTMPIIGASGGISGLFGGVLIMLKHDGRASGENQKLAPMILMWIAISAIFGVMGGPNGENIAWLAHIGGFLGGLVIAAVMFKKSRRLS